jgi:hypothetical protein
MNTPAPADYFALMEKAAQARRAMENVRSAEALAALTDFAADCERQANALLQQKLGDLAGEAAKDLRNALRSKQQEK